ncbi:hypothetical protein HNE05_07985 [Aquipseudomonas campi]|uniref:Uncharacterized protein n=1 Tax=Aquipseudomonas campi TaxID=2731681 RepID=A0A6M8FAW1_9GAMM|nr:hypothetical protein [Pseudomonas campi]QKE63303.1 hypothetical protein HNE05_07985 [Pseudomonas campi]
MNEIILKLVEFSSWPIVVLIAAYLLRDPIKKLISRFNGIRAGDIEIQMRQQMHAQSLTEEQLEKISVLSTDEIDLFLLVSFTEAIGFNYTVPIPKNILHERLYYLEKLGLLKIYPPESEDAPIRHDCTPEGRRVRELIINGASQLVRSTV